MKNKPTRKRRARSAARCPTHPGALLRDIVLPALDIQRQQFAAALGVSRQTLHDILSERHPVTPKIAVRLGKALGVSPQSWMAAQAEHDIWHAAQKIDLRTIRRLG